VKLVLVLFLALAAAPAAEAGRGPRIARRTPVVRPRARLPRRPAARRSHVLPRLVAPRADLHFQPLDVHLPRTGRQLQRRFRRELEAWRGARIAERAGSVFVVVPARNEEREIRATLDHLLGALQESPSMEVAVVDNGSTDATGARIRAWARAHAGEVDLIDHTSARGRHAAARPARGRLRLHLLEEKVPGKTGALLRTRDLFATLGYAPEWIAQLDADSRIRRGQVEALVAGAAGGGHVAATGVAEEVRWNGEPVALYRTKGPGTPPGQWQNLNGGFLVARTAAFLAGYRAIAATFPAAATEDALFSATLRIAGFSTAPPDPAVRFQTLGPRSEQEARKRLVRVRSGDIQVERIYGHDTLARIGHATDWKGGMDLDHLAGSWGAGDERRARWISVMREARRAAAEDGTYTWTPSR